MKQNKVYVIAVLLLVIALSISGVVRAHSSTDKSQNTEVYESMDLMHEEMTENLDSVNKAVADQMHSACSVR